MLRAERRHARLGVRAAEQHQARRSHGPGETVIAREEVDDGPRARSYGFPKPIDSRSLSRYFAELPDGEAAGLVGTSTEAYRVRLVRARETASRRLLEERRWLSASWSFVYGQLPAELDSPCASVRPLGLLRGYPLVGGFEGGVSPALVCVVVLAGVVARRRPRSPRCTTCSTSTQVQELGPLAPGVAPPFAGRRRSR